MTTANKQINLRDHFRDVGAELGPSPMSSTSITCSRCRGTEPRAQRLAFLEPECFDHMGTRSRALTRMSLTIIDKINAKLITNSKGRSPAQPNISHREAFDGSR